MYLITVHEKGKGDETYKTPSLDTALWKYAQFVGQDRKVTLTNN